MKQNKIVLGLTGTIASGKSTAAAYFGQWDGVMVVDTDRIGHEVLNRPDVQKALCEAYDEDIICAGKTDRKKLGSRALADADSHARLNQITHPAIYEAVLKIKQAYKADKQHRLMVLEAYGLLEPGWRTLTDLLVVVGCDERIRMKRVMERQKLSEDEAWMRIKAQETDEVYRQAADIYLDGSGDPAWLYAQCRLIMKRMMRIEEKR